MVVWLIQRGWVRLLLLILMGAMVLAAMIYDPSKTVARTCVTRSQAGAWGEGCCPHAPARHQRRADAADR